MAVLMHQLSHLLDPTIHSFIIYYANWHPATGNNGIRLI